MFKNCEYNMSEKLDTNFNRLNERLDKAFGQSNKK